MKEKDFNEYVASQFTKARLKTNFTQNEVAQKINVANSATIGRYETGDRQPNLYTFYKLITMYKTDANYFFPECNSIENNIPVFVMIDDVSNIDKVKKASSVLQVSNDFTDCFAFIAEDSEMEPLIKKGDTIIFQKSDTLKEDGVYLLKTNNNVKVRITNVSIDGNYCILYSPQNINIPQIFPISEIIPIAKACEIRHKL